MHLGSHGLASVPQPQSFGQRAKLKAEEACREEAQGLCKCSGPEYTLGQHCYGISTGACSGRISPNAMPWSAWVTTGIVKFTAHVQTVFYGVAVFIHFLTIKTVWPSGLRRWLKAPFRKGVDSNPTAVNVAIHVFFLNNSDRERSVFNSGSEVGCRVHTLRCARGVGFKAGAV